MIDQSNKEVRYCGHIKSQQARPYIRAIGEKYDLIMCWECNNVTGPALSKIGELQERLDRLTKRETG